MVHWVTIPTAKRAKQLIVAEFDKMAVSVASCTLQLYACSVHNSPEAVEHLLSQPLPWQTLPESQCEDIIRIWAWRGNLPILKLLSNSLPIRFAVVFLHVAQLAPSHVIDFYLAAIGELLKQKPMVETECRLYDLALRYLMKRGLYSQCSELSSLTKIWLRSEADFLPLMTREYLLYVAQTDIPSCSISDQLREELFVVAIGIPELYVKLMVQGKLKVISTNTSNVELGLAGVYYHDILTPTTHDTVTAI